MTGSLERVLSRVLGVGVLLAAGLCAAALVWHLLNNTSGETPKTAGAILRAVRGGQPLALAQAGVLVLVLTPMVRVSFTVIGLWMKGSKVVALIALSTLAILGVGIARVVGGGWAG